MLLGWLERHINACYMETLKVCYKIITIFCIKGTFSRSIRRDLKHFYRRSYRFIRRGALRVGFEGYVAYMGTLSCVEWVLVRFEEN